MSFENDQIQKFKHSEYVLNNYDILSRPNQLLKTHIQSMVNEFLKNLTGNEYIDVSTILSILFHDFGKINLRFQYKIKKNKKLSPINQELSYHSQTSVYFLHLFCKCINTNETNMNIEKISSISRFVI